MAEARVAPTLDLGPARPVEPPVAGRFIPNPLGGRLPTPSESPTQPRSAGIIAPEQGPSVAIDDATAVKDIIDAVPPVQRSDPKFIGPEPDIREVGDSLQGSSGQTFAVEPASPGLGRRITDFLGIK